MTHPQNIFANTPDDIPEELVETLVDSQACRIERVISQGHVTRSITAFREMNSFHQIKP